MKTKTYRPRWCDCGAKFTPTAPRQFDCEGCRQKTPTVKTTKRKRHNFWAGYPAPVR